MSYVTQLLCHSIVNNNFHGSFSVLKDLLCTDLAFFFFLL